MDVFKKIYDCIVIGDNLGGIVLATLLEKRGANVLLVINKDDKRTFQYKDYQLRAEVPFIAGIERGEFFKKILCEISYDSIHEFNDQNPLYQLITEDFRLEFFTDINKQRAAFHREFHTSLDEIFKIQTTANEVTKIVSLFLESHNDILFTRNFFKIKYLEYKLKKLLADFSDAFNLERSHDGIINTLFNPLAFAFSYLSDRESCTLPFYCNVSSNYKKVSERFLNLAATQDFFIDQFKNFRGDIEDLSELDGFSSKGRSLKGISLNKGAKEFFCRYIVFNGSFPFVVTKLNGSFWVKGLKKVFTNTLTKSFYFRIHYIVDRNVIPVGMHERVILMNGGDYPKPLYISITAHPENHEQATITASIELPCETRYSHEDYKRMIASMRSALESLIPFFNEFVIDEFPSQKSIEIDEERSLFDTYLEFLRTSDYNFTIALKRNPIELLKARGVTTPFRNVFIQGRSVLPAFGITGEIIAAHAIADYITNKVRFY